MAPRDWMLAKSDDRSDNPVMRQFIAIGLRLVPLVLASTVATAQEPAPVDPVIAALVEAHNVERAGEKLPPLKLAPLLEVAARGHAKDMADRELMTHDGADGSTPSQRIARAGYHFLTVGENVAKWYPDVPAVMKGWMDSPPHKKNILGDFTEIGLARVDGKDGKPYWCADFGKPIPKYEPAEAEADLLKRLNQQRADAKLPAMAIDPNLARSAREQAGILAKSKGQGGTPLSFDGVDEKKFRELAMTTAVGQPDAEAVVKTFLDSPGHREKLLGKFSRVGIGYATAEDGVPSWCVILASPVNR